jgi:RHS repeat-associated protein
MYDGAGHRVQETLNGNIIKQWVWCGLQPCEERDGSGKVTKRFYAQGEQIGGVPYYFTRDHLGSVREMTDGTGAIRARYDYDPYGRATKMSGDPTADFGFTRDYYHAATGLSQTMYRAYDPNLGRWLNRDPAGLSGGINLYVYVGDNPISAIDPFGLSPLTAQQQGSVQWVIDQTRAQGFPAIADRLQAKIANGTFNVDASMGSGEIGRVDTFQTTINLNPAFIGQSQTFANTVVHEYVHTVQNETIGSSIFTQGAKLASMVSALIDGGESVLQGGSFDYIDREYEIDMPEQQARYLAALVFPSTWTPQAPGSSATPNGKCSQ